MVDLSHLRNNRKVVTATLAGVAVVAISVGVGVGLTRGPGESPVDDSVPTGQADTEPLGDKESFLRVDALDELPEGADIVDGEKSKRVGVNYNSGWGSGGDNAWGGGGGSPVRCPDGSIAAKAGKANAGAVIAAAGKSGKSGQPGRRCKYLSWHTTHIIVL
jgi:hypothetical protein